MNFGICGEEAMILVYKFDIFEIFSNFENENQILVYKENPCKIWYIIRKKNFGIRRKSINFGIYQEYLATPPNKVDKERSKATY